MRFRLFALPLLLALLGASCEPQPGTSSASTDKHTVEIGPTAAADAHRPPPMQPLPVDATKAPSQTTQVLVVPLSKPASNQSPLATKTTATDTVDYSCRTSADCAVKNVGNCCGQYPACVNKDSRTFPDQVRAQCGKEHRMGVCGFPSISGCECVHGKCSSLTDVSGGGSVR